MAYLEVVWDTGDYLTQTDMRQMMSNDEFARDRTDYLHITYPATIVEYAQSNGTDTVTLWINSIQVGSAITGGHEANIDITGYTEGNLHTLQLRIGSVSGPVLRWVRLEDHDYRDVWFNTSHMGSAPEDSV